MSKKEEQIEEIKLGEEEIAQALKYITQEEIYEPPNSDWVVYHKCYLPIQDIGLLDKDVTLCARTSYHSKLGDINNNIIIKRGKKTASIKCVHTAICELEPLSESEEGLELGMKVVSTEQRPELLAQLTASDHYFSLKSFVEALAERGVQNTLIESYRRQIETGEEPIDMNQLMRNQLTGALAEIVPEESKELVLFSLELSVQDDPQRMEAFSDDFQDVICKYFTGTDIARLHKIDGGIAELHPTIQSCISGNPNFPMGVIQELATKPPSGFSSLLQEQLRYSKAKQEQAIKNNDSRVRAFMAGVKNLEPYLVWKLSKDMDVNVKVAVAQREDLEPEIAEELWKSKNHKIQQTLLQHHFTFERTSPRMKETLRRLIQENK